MCLRVARRIRLLLTIRTRRFDEREVIQYDLERVMFYAGPIRVRARMQFAGHEDRIALVEVFIDCFRSFAPRDNIDKLRDGFLPVSPARISCALRQD